MDTVTLTCPGSLSRMLYNPLSRRIVALALALARRKLTTHHCIWCSEGFGNGQTMVSQRCSCDPDACVACVQKNMLRQVKENYVHATTRRYRLTVVESAGPIEPTVITVLTALLVIPEVLNHNWCISSCVSCPFHGSKQSSSTTNYYHHNNITNLPNAPNSKAWPEG